MAKSDNNIVSPPVVAQVVLRCLNTLYGCVFALKYFAYSSSHVHKWYTTAPEVSNSIYTLLWLLWGHRNAEQIPETVGNPKTELLMLVWERHAGSTTHFLLSIQGTCPAHEDWGSSPTS